MGGMAKTEQMMVTENASFLNQLATTSENALREVREAISKLETLAGQLEEGAPWPIDFASGPVTRYQENLAKRQALVQVSRLVGATDEELRAALTDPGETWFQDPKKTA